MQNLSGFSRAPSDAKTHCQHTTVPMRLRWHSPAKTWAQLSVGQCRPWRLQAPGRAQPHCQTCPRVLVVPDGSPWVPQLGGTAGLHPATRLEGPMPFHSSGEMVGSAGCPTQGTGSCWVPYAGVPVLGTGWTGGRGHEGTATDSLVQMGAHICLLCSDDNCIYTSWLKCFNKWLPDENTFWWLWCWFLLIFPMAQVTVQIKIQNKIKKMTLMSTPSEVSGTVSLLFSLSL